MLNFLENHDEQRFGSDFFGKDGKHTFAALYTSLMLNTAPFMIYFGEETGERGMDKEGFSGKDGRTTIFDWWSVDSVRRLRKVITNEAYRSLDVNELVRAGLLKNEAEIFVKFAKAVRFAASDEAVSKGTTYDLSYCNFSSDGFNKDRHYAFLRDYKDHTVLVAVNFSNTEAKMKIVIPEHAFEWMEIEITDSLYPGKTIELCVGPYDGTIISLM